MESLKKRILFVDDELRILQSLERLLRPNRRELEATFANGGEAALAIMKARPFDVLVTDIRMPRVDGLAVLRYAQTHQPHMLRIALSGQTDLESMLRSVGLAHQFLGKPCGVELLRSVINNACELYQRLRSDELRVALTSLGALPSLPGQYYELSERLSAPRVSRDEVVLLIERDVGMLARVLQIVNSPIFRAAKPILTAREAVSSIGVQALREIFLVGQVFHHCEAVGSPTFSVPDFYRHSFLVGSLSRAIAPTPEQSGEAFTAGMLHDVGRLILATRLPETYQEIVRQAAQRRVRFHEAEAPGASHSLLGAALFSLWGLPYSVVEAVAKHHEVGSLRPREFGVPDAVYTAELLLTQLEDDSLELSEQEGLYLRRAGVLERLPRWRELAKSLLARSEQGLSLAM